MSNISSNLSDYHILCLFYFTKDAEEDWLGYGSLVKLNAFVIGHKCNVYVCFNIKYK